MRPRRCVLCDAPIVVSEGRTLDDRAAYRGQTHDCDALPVRRGRGLTSRLSGEPGPCTITKEQYLRDRA
jgi:hypothetical protein